MTLFCQKTANPHYLIEKNDARKEIIEELKITQDILLKQEAYALGALSQAYIFIGGLILALLSGRIHIPPVVFSLIFLAIFIGSLYLQNIYRAAFYKGVDRSIYLQDLLGGRLLIATNIEYKPFDIHGNIRAPWSFWKVFCKDMRESRFLVPNSLLLLISISFIWYYSNHQIPCNQFLASGS